MCAGMAWALPRDLQNRIDAADPTGVPASAVVAVVLVILLLVVFSMAVQWSVTASAGHRSPPRRSDPSRAWTGGRVARLGATRTFHHGLLE